MHRGLTPLRSNVRCMCPAKWTPPVLRVACFRLHFRSSGQPAASHRHPLCQRFLMRPSGMVRKLFPLILLLQFSTSHAIDAPPSSVLGYWREPGGSVIHIDTCETGLCAVLAALPAAVPATSDVNNPDASLHNRPLCGLRIGEGFRSEGDRATGGHLYNPRNGKTYRGSIEAKGDALDLRGYIGFKAFGRSVTWTRLNEPPPACTAKAEPPAAPSSGS